MPFIDDIPLVRKYVELFETYSWNNTLFGVLSIHVIIGQILKHMRIWKGSQFLDPRMSIFLLQDTRSGKSWGFNFVFDIAEKLEMGILSPDELTDAALLGTQEKVEFRDPDTGLKAEDWVTVPGVLNEADIVHYDEASMLFRTGKWNQKTVEILQKALNPIDTPSNTCYKKLSHGDPIQFNPTCSLLLTSYMPPGISSFVIQTGLFQRMLVLPRRLSESIRRSNSMIDIELLGDRTDSKKKLDSLLTEFRIIKNTFKDKETFEWDERTFPLLRNKTNKLFELVAPTHPRVRDILYGFIPAYQNFMYTLSCHHAAIRGQTTVMPHDVQNGFIVPFNIMKWLVAWLEGEIDTGAIDKEQRGRKSREEDFRKAFRSVFASLKKNDNLTIVGRTRLIKETVEVSRSSYPTVTKYLELFMSMGYIGYRIEGNKKLYWWKGTKRGRPRKNREG